MSMYPVIVNPTLSVKASYGEDLRRFVISSRNFDSLAVELKKIYGFANNFPLVVKYQDDEGDLITLSSSPELEIALQLARDTPLRLILSSKEGTPSQPLIEIKETVPVVIDSPIIATSEAPASPSAEVPATASIESPQWKKKEYKLRKTLHKGEKKINKLQEKQEKKLTKKFLSPDEKLKLKAERMAEKLKKKEEKLMTRQLQKGTARLVSDVTVPEGAAFTPATPFIKTWRIRNEGEITWPLGCLMVFKKGDQLSIAQCVPLSKEVAPGEEIDISVQMTSPSLAGKYHSCWKLSGPQGFKFFGQPFHVKITVTGSAPSSPSAPSAPASSVSPVSSPLRNTPIVPSLFDDHLRQLHEMGFNDDAHNVKLLIKFHGDLDKVVVRLVQKKLSHSPCCESRVKTKKG